MTLQVFGKLFPSHISNSNVWDDINSKKHTKLYLVSYMSNSVSNIVTHQTLLVTYLTWLVTYQTLLVTYQTWLVTRAFRTSESADFREVRVRKFRTMKTLQTRTQRVCLFTHLYSKEVNISQKNSEISIFSFLKSYYSLYKPHAQISTLVKTS
jgi:hypothetical protein